VEECLTHPYLESYHDPEDEPSAKPLPSDFFDFDMQKDEISRAELKKLLCVLSCFLFTNVAHHP